MINQKLSFASFKLNLALVFLGASSVTSLASADSIKSQPLNPAKVPADEASPGTKFQLLSPQETGIDFVQPIDITHPKKQIYVGGFASAGVAIGDLNNDGLQDVFITGGPVKNRLYLQMAHPDGSASFRFKDVTEKAGVDGGDTWCSGASMVDIDNDGDLDIYVCKYDSPNELFINRTTHGGTIRFDESAREYGLDLVDACLVSAFCDYDLDGDLDVFIAGYQYVNPAGRPKEPPVIENNGRYSIEPEFQKYYGIIRGPDGGQVFTNIGREDYLLESNAANNPQAGIVFTNVTNRAGIEGVGVGNSVVWWDYNNDGLPDLFIGNDFKAPDQLYRNNGNRTFTDVIRKTVSHTTWFSMGSDVGDINNDGRLDLFVSDMAGTTHYRSKVTMGEMSANKTFLMTSEPRQFMRNALFLNTGSDRFLEAAYLGGIANSDWSWATKMADFDNDGWVDIFMTNGAARMFNHSDRNFTDEQRHGKTQWELWENSAPRLEENLAFKNQGDLNFKDVSVPWGLHHKGMSYSTAYGDLDNDGDLDLIVTNLDEPVSVYKNQTDDAHRVRIRLVGQRSNRYGVGAIVRIETQAGQQVRQMMPMTGFVSCNEPLLHFGLGEAEKISKLTVEWPSRVVQEFHDLEADQLYEITEAGNPTKQSVAAAAKPLFRAAKSFPAIKHTETDYDDFARQPLLAFKHSQLGPGIATGDIDRDGDLDFYIGRAAGQRRAIYLNRGKGQLGVRSLDAFRADTQHEDMGAIFFDADGDGADDLYVVSGSVECEPGASVLRDRLYLNDGKGHFKRTADALPDFRDSGSVVCAADYDRDGDLDLFVGGRIIPGQYPVAPNSRLLTNESQPAKPSFVDETAQLAPELMKTGLVTSAIWSDPDNDGWIDLLVSHEWGPIKYFRNEPNADGQRQLIDRTEEAGLSERLGWWNGINGRDLDNDGDIDYVVSNFGLNTTYHASEEKPELLYYGDFDESGTPHLIEAKYEKDRCLPRRGMSCSSHAMPFVRQKLGTFHNFGLATLEDIYTEKKLSESLRLVANELSSGILINLGKNASGVPSFQFQPLPKLAQISPAFGVSIADFDADGWADCFLAQNFFSPQFETGRMDSGLSLMLRGQGKGPDEAIHFKASWPRESGISIPADAKATSVLDFTEDGRLDLLVTTNDNEIEAFASLPTKNRELKVELLGPPGNPQCVGAQVTIEFADGTMPAQMAEIYAGSGYLSQCSSKLLFGCGPEGKPQLAKIRWPNGKLTTEPIRDDQSTLILRQP
ncbi:MAG: RNA-binding protein [Planctomycetaceae bacterium]|nr:RNA-binding protein [Planctomycetaceae bacterium]